MPYIVIKVGPRTHQIKLEEIILHPVDVSRFFEKPTKVDKGLTRTYFRSDDKIPQAILQGFDFDQMIGKLEGFVTEHQDLYNVQNRHDLYETFKIPKKSGGLRTINAPQDELKAALRELKAIFEQDCKAMWHAAAYAYVPGRSTMDCVKKHQKNESRWF